MPSLTLYGIHPWPSLTVPEPTINLTNILWKPLFIVHVRFAKHIYLFGLKTYARETKYGFDLIYYHEQMQKIKIMQGFFSIHALNVILYWQLGLNSWAK